MLSLCDFFSGGCSALSLSCSSVCAVADLDTVDWNIFFSDLLPPSAMPSAALCGHAAYAAYISIMYIRIWRIGRAARGVCGVMAVPCAADMTTYAAYISLIYIHLRRIDRAVRACDLRRCAHIFGDTVLCP